LPKFKNIKVFWQIQNAINLFFNLKKNGVFIPTILLSTKKAYLILFKTKNPIKNC